MGRFIGTLALCLSAWSGWGINTMPDKLEIKANVFNAFRLGMVGGSIRYYWPLIAFIMSSMPFGLGWLGDGGEFQGLSLRCQAGM